MKRIVTLMLLAPGPLVAESGEGIWKGTCQACHAEPLSGAPLITSKAASVPRLAKSKEALHRSAIHGNPSLSDEQVKAAVDYMVSKQGEVR